MTCTARWIWHEEKPDLYQKSTENLLNPVTYGWWLDRVYDYNDADHIQFGNYYHDKDTYLAVCNFGKAPREFRIDPERIGLPYRSALRELCSSRTFTSRGRTDVTVPGEDAVIYKVTS
ncbi:hypothetical protein [Kibdelosporangium phytohabitans]|uniref:Uncharacterized protein n=1 Tax=Kibdelosporangium phytohabitans TaxID=860235 RepID=A0A0N9HSP8_9PSEU|nr:hypothetical protein [Kibdelosporangium phytohabitans]ALG07941.1 hypothetical protein AOZ06_14350 [Kibdelosporangium phytohabitans]MBE1471119.1 hypothetical protein [Kibdelosporangium phytohabitans]